MGSFLGRLGDDCHGLAVILAPGHEPGAHDRVTIPAGKVPGKLLAALFSSAEPARREHEAAVKADVIGEVAAFYQAPAAGLAGGGASTSIQ